MPLIFLLVLLAALTGVGWLARARRLRGERRARLRDVLLQSNVGGDRFQVATVDALPGPAASYLRRALAPDAPLARSVDVRMSGRMRVAADDWVPFEARQRICAERGFLWEARVGVLRHLGLHGSDWLFGDDAGAEYHLADWWPVIDQRRPEMARSAVGRLLVELVWLPSALTPQRGAVWASGDPDRAVVTPAGGKNAMTVAVADDGRLREISIVRRRMSANGETSIAPYGVSVEAEERWGDFRVPSRLVAAWGIGTDDREDFMHLSVDDIRWF